MKYFVLFGTKKNGDNTTVLVAETMVEDAKENDMSLAEYVGRPGDKLEIKGNVNIIGDGADYLPEILEEQ